jgi:tetratricopeptide (TPR) repeat protein|tara:strand:- start:145 stop:450 length:306 start_codon:yes stop_codon:yes gene_type:complete
MAGPSWRNIYSLDETQIDELGMAEDHMELMEINEAESILKRLIDVNPNCIPALNVMGHMQGRYLSDFESAIVYYEQVLKLEPDNIWARDERRRYQRYLKYD